MPPWTRLGPPLLLLLSSLLWPGGAAAAACDAALADRVQASLGWILPATSCPENQWLQDFLLSDSRRGVNRTAVVLDVGCNKGFDALNALNLFRQEVVVSGRRWQAVSQFNCGVCGQCTGPDHVAVRGARGRPTEVYCAEPLPANFHHLNATAAHFHLEQHGFHTIHAAFTSEEDAHARHWTAKFPVWLAKEHRKEKHSGKLIGYEGAGIGVNPSCTHCSTVNVPLMVLDRLVEQRQLPVIDYLSIDTEGNDPNVLLGANRSLPLVRYLEFEYHKVGVWAHTSLRDVVERLKGHGFACYWIGKGKVQAGPVALHSFEPAGQAHPPPPGNARGFFSKSGIPLLPRDHRHGSLLLFGNMSSVPLTQFVHCFDGGEVLTDFKRGGQGCQATGGSLWLKWPACWHDAYHKHDWSNVGCVQTREAEWYAILEDYFNRTVPH